jgi:N-acetylglucosamine kinase-like BadF-type ATPase
VGASLDGRGPETVLTALLLRAIAPAASPGPGVVTPDTALRHLVSWVYALPPVHLARFAPLAFEALAAEDAVATQIVTRAGRALAATLAAVVTADLDGPVVLGGSVLVNQAVVRDLVRASLERGGRFPPTHLVEDGLVGAGILALRNARVVVDPTVHGHVTESLGRLR